MFQALSSFAMPALIVLALFYGVYLSKQLLLRRRGIRCVQMGKGKAKKTNTVETVMGIATVGIIIVQLLSILSGFSRLPAPLRLAGFIIGLTGDIVFLLSVIAMKDSWRVGIPNSGKTALVTEGVYAFSRNPAFLGFDLQYIGILLMFCNALTLLFTLFAMVMLHLQILQEEKYLTGLFGDDYRDYCRRVPGRYLCFPKKK
ncbi:MAG: isoprenylcysteine carboxylmethyltransferase family protein [Clostridia bacterium]|nr:isoprenylcysteine carboxylmethyltransferase family protein [Clostridia bacterium]